MPPCMCPPRFYASFVASWRESRTTWLAVLWVTLFLLAVGLLVGLLIPWHRVQRLDFAYPPTLLAPGPTSVSALFSLSRGGVLYYAVLPAALTDLNASR